jgi:hypothetical protein
MFNFMNLLHHLKCLVNAVHCEAVDGKGGRNLELVWVKKKYAQYIRRMNHISLSNSDCEDNAKAKGYHEIVCTWIQISALLAAYRLDLYLYFTECAGACIQFSTYMFGWSFYHTRSWISNIIIYILLVNMKLHISTLHVIYTITI